MHRNPQSPMFHIVYDLEVSLCVKSPHACLVLRVVVVVGYSVSTHSTQHIHTSLCHLVYDIYRTCGTRIHVAHILQLTLAPIALVTARTVAALGAFHGVVALHVPGEMTRSTREIYYL